MLKALELYGFKSFADRTRFEFPPGITVVVGPNGSGKSNVVDAMKWVLGEQSAKSLRGKEMADVIFKGSGTQGGRKPGNTAEVSIIFDNQEGLLAAEGEEVRVTRRVYRSGEGEYLINGDPCRLRDVKDLFRGTGVGTDAYSLIEQGKVDTLLQASPRERRAIFEEAAGISRFKAKKVETQRRLERVAQNLVRLADIVDEVENRLRSVRNQARKAQRYKQYSDRLKQLRTHVGAADFRRLTQKLVESQTELQQIEERRAAAEQAVGQHEQEVQQAETVMERFDDRVHQYEAQASQVNQALATHRSTSMHERARLAELEHEIRRYRRQWLSMTTRVGDVGLQLRQVQQALDVAARQDAEVQARLSHLQSEVTAINQELESARSQRKTDQDSISALMRQHADVERRLAALESERTAAQQRVTENERRLQAVDSQLATAQAEFQREQEQEKLAQAADQEADENLRSTRAELRQNEKSLQQLQDDWTEVQRRRAAATERANVLEDLEQRHEGLHPGVKDVLRDAHDDPAGPFGTVCGLVADLVRVDVRFAPLIDVALGELTQYVVVEGNMLIDAIASGRVQLTGRVGLLDAAQKRHEAKTIITKAPSDAIGLLGHATEFVEVESKYESLIQQLLGQTWCVESLPDALRLVESDPRSRCVTRAGELVESGGRVLLGPRQTGLGLVSRRSELRTLRVELQQLCQQDEQLRGEVTALRASLAATQQQVSELQADRDRLNQELTERRVASQAASERVESFKTQQASIQQDVTQSQAKIATANHEIQETQQQSDELATRIGELEENLSTVSARQQQLESEVKQKQQSLNELLVERAKCEQRVDDLQGQLLRFQEDQKERARAMAETQEQLAEAIRRLHRAEQVVLSATSAIADLSVQSERQQAEHRDVIERRAEAVTAMKQLKTQLAAARDQLNQYEQTHHKLELQVNEATLQRQTVAQRVREDYGIEISELEEAPETEDELRERDQVDREIEDLRRKLSNIGAVNMAALEEIEQLEQRHTALATQYQDLVDAKEALARIIHRINADSRRLFTESLEQIRANFQSLFRRVFGGGDADIVLEPDVDILEAGIDIVATPPGKHSLGISLLSGGERALTAVTLLLAIFQYRPSPFCVLDEVDGPLDEANIGRFIDVLNEFLQWTKFVVVTHSKKTMTAATTLYGVTMQESGVSKRVSVQFEDVSDDGHIRPGHGRDEFDDQAKSEDERGAA